MKLTFPIIGLAVGVMFFGYIQPLSAGTMVNTVFADTATDFTSIWEWRFTEGTWATPAVTAGGVPAHPHWKATLQGFADRSLKDTSTHISNPHGLPEISPNFLSFYVYAGAAGDLGGIGPIVTEISHPFFPDHVDQYTLQTFVVTPDFFRISLSGVHIGEDEPLPGIDPPDDLRFVPEPCTLVLVGTGVVVSLLGGARHSRRGLIRVFRRGPLCAFFAEPLGRVA